MRIKKALERKDDRNISFSCYTWNGPQRLGKKKTGRIGNQRKNQDLPDNSIVKIG